MPNLPPSPADFARLIARVETLERAQKDRSPRRLDQLDDVAVPQPVADDALVFDGKKWVPGTGALGGVSGYYNVGAPIETNVPTATATNLDWPTLTIGEPVLDLSTIDAPVTQTAGQHTINATIALASNEAPGDTVIVLVRITDGGTPYSAETNATLLGSATADVFVSLSLTAVVAAGATVELIALQTSGGPIGVRVQMVAVTGPS